MKVFSTMASASLFFYFFSLPTLVALRRLDADLNQTAAGTEVWDYYFNQTEVSLRGLDDFNKTRFNHLANALHISDVSGVAFVDQECGAGSVMDIAVNECVEFGCPSTWRVHKDEFKCMPTHAPAPPRIQGHRSPTPGVGGSPFFGSSMFHSGSGMYMCLALLSRSDHPSPRRGFLSSRDDIEWSPPCAEWKFLKLSELNFSPSCGLIMGDRHIPHTDLSLEPVGSEYHVHFCIRYHFDSRCLLRWVNRSQTHQYQGNLLVERAIGKSVIYPLGMYVPFSEVYGVCIVPESTWIRQTRNAQLVVSLIGACTSPCCYILVLITFAVSKELFPGHGVISMFVCLISADFLYLFAVVLHTVKVELFNHLCVGLAIVSHFLLLTELLSIVLLALDNLLAFRKVQMLAHDTTKKYYTKRSILMMFPIFIIGIVLILDYTGQLDGGYGCGAGFCMLQGVYARVAFYTVPVLATFLFSVSIMVYTLFKLRHHTKKAKMSNEGGSNKTSYNLAVIALKLIVAYGLIDVFGFIHSPLKAQLEIKVNVIFGLIYTCVRSLRGMMFFGIYLCRGSVLKFYRRKFMSKKLRHEERLANMRQIKGMVQKGQIRP